MLHKSSLEEHHKPSPQDQLAGPRLPFRQSVELVLEASREYYDSSNDLSDSAMELARYDSSVQIFSFQEKVRAKTFFLFV